MSSIADDCGGPARQVPADNGGPAFPISEDAVNYYRRAGVLLFAGMSLRDYFAAHAPAVPEWYTAFWLDMNRSGPVSKSAIELSWPYAWADAQLTERAK